MIVLRFSVTVNNNSVMSGLRHRFPDKNYQFLDQGYKADLRGSNPGPIDLESDVVLLSQHVSLCVIKCIEISTRRMATKRVCFCCCPGQQFFSHVGCQCFLDSLPVLMEASSLCLFVLTPQTTNVQSF